MKPEEDCEGEGDALNDDPGHEAVELGLNQTGTDFLDLEREDEPLWEVQEEKEHGDLPTRLRIKQIQGQGLEKREKDKNQLCCGDNDTPGGIVDSSPFSWGQQWR